MFIRFSIALASEIFDNGSSKYNNMDAVSGMDDQ